MNHSTYTSLLKKEPTSTKLLANVRLHLPVTHLLAVMITEMATQHRGVHAKTTVWLTQLTAQVSNGMQVPNNA
jgi:hypothetical protein